jgi:gluconate 2-dehydrogenase gamma chain
MTSRGNWETVPDSPDGWRQANERLFFDEHQWATIDAATARIIPADRDPGAREAEVVRFIDRYLSGINYIYASADGSGFLRIGGKDADAWRERVQEAQEKYTEGIRELDEVSRQKFGADFIALTDEQQDEVLVTLADEPMPERIMITTEGQWSGAALGGPPPTNQPISDEGLDFFHMLVMHTRQGFYADPVYGGNKNHIGWKVIGFPGPKSLAETHTGQYTTAPYLFMDAEWPYPQDARVLRHRLK